MIKNQACKLFIIVLCTTLVACTTEVGKDENKNLPQQELDAITKEMAAVLDQFPIDSLQIPRSLTKEGTLHGVKSKDWTSGFFPGTLWYIYEYSQDDRFLDAARTWTAFIEKEKFDSTTHDTGFKVYCSFGNGYRLTGEERYKDIIIRAAQTLISRYNENVKCIRSWDHNKKKWQFPVIVDNMMNLEMLFAATRFSGDSIYYQIANNHALNTLKNHYRDDFSSYHVVDYDPETGEVKKKETHQGNSHESSWSRGQSWGLYGFTMTYRETRNPVFLEQAVRIANYMLDHQHLPSDKIPYWDFDAPNIPNEERDVSAATIMASALYELSTFVSGEEQQKFRKAAEEITNILSSKSYRRTASKLPFILNHSVGSKPGGTEVDVPIIYADYYYLEAFLRRKKLMFN